MEIYLCTDNAHLNDLLRTTAEPEMSNVTTKQSSGKDDDVYCVTMLSEQKLDICSFSLSSEVSNNTNV